ncbi:TonB-dependent receptor domain-containing protein [Chitinophaga sancti]|uniref:TonB-dependent receptor domain-containing protein n=1 Tax=Chitinophaga sancti TaxID=1004 RepID=UPI003F78EE27
MKPIQLSVLFFCLCSTVRLPAQSLRLSVSGKITDSLSNQNLPFAIVLLLTDTIRQTTQTDKEGNFTFENLKPGVYNLQVRYLGYRDKTSAPFQLSTQSLTLPAIGLLSVSYNLITHQVTALKPLIEQTVDKMIINVAESPLATGNTLEELLRRSPGVRLDDDGSITLNGKKVMVYLNDRPSYFTAAMLKNLLLSTASNAVEKIELIANPSVKYDAAASAVINIKLKKTGKSGTNGSLSIGGGGGRYGRYTGGGDLNYRNDNLNIYGNYNYQRNEQYTDTHTDRILEDEFIEEKNHEVRKKDIHNVNAGISYTIDKHNNIGLDLKGNFLGRDRDGIDQTLFYVSQSAPFDSLLNMHTTGHANINNYSANLFYQHNFDSTGTQLSINGDYAYYDQRWRDNFNTAYLDTDMKIYQIPYVIRNSSPVSVAIRSVSADFTRPTKIGSFDAGLKTVFVKTDSDIRWEVLDNDTWVNDATKTNHFIYDENVNAGYINYHNQFKKWVLQAGVRVENTHVKGNSITNATVFNKDYTGVYPGFSLQYMASAQQRFGVSVRRSIDRPQYEYVNPFLFFRSKYYYFQGNPDLNPQNATSLELSHSWKQHLFTTLSISRTNNVIAGVYIAGDNKVLITTYQNVTHYDNYNLNITYTTSPTKWWNTMNAVQVFYIHYDYNDITLPKSKPGAYVISNNTFNIPHLFTLELNAVYSSNSNAGLSALTSYWVLNTGIQRNLLKNKATLKLSVNDVFRGQQFALSSNYQGVNVKQHFAFDSRFAMLSFTYRFGNRKIKARTERQTGIEKEKKRIQSN